MASTIWKGRLVFGLVSIPVRLYKAARRERVQFHNVYRTGGAPADAPDSSPSASKVRPFPGQGPSPQESAAERVARVRRAFVGYDSNAPIGKDDLLKGYEVERDRYVVLESNEVNALRARSSTNLEIAQFVGIEEIDRNYFDASYYVAPDHGGEKAYALFYRALAETACVAVGELVMYGREYAVVIRPGRRGLVLHTLFFANEVRVDEESPADLGLVNEKELELAKMLVNAQRGTFDATKLKDKFRERVLEVIESRASSAVPGGSATQERAPAPVVDIMDALRRSLDAARKPPQSEAGKVDAKRRKRLK